MNLFINEIRFLPKQKKTGKRELENQSCIQIHHQFELNYKNQHTKKVPFNHIQ